MKKIEVRNLAEYFGAKLPAGRIKDRDTRIAIVRLYGSLAVAGKAIGDEIEEVRKGLVGDKEADIHKWASLVQKAADDKLSEEVRAAAKAEADAMTECQRIDKDYQQAVVALLEEEADVAVKAVPLEVLYEALSDCGFPNLHPDTPLAAVEQIFSPVIA